MIVRIIIAAAAAYLLGSINSSIIVGRIYGKDIRNYGSGNAGLTNAIRVLGKKSAVFVLLGDIAKGILACILSSVIIASDLFPVYTVGGLFVIIGHNWPLYFKFKGGKGALTAMTAAFMIDPASASVLIVIFIAVLLIFRYVSLATITACLSYPLAVHIFTGSPYILAYSAAVALLVIYRHRTNIKRLLRKEEPRIGSRS
jgi:acyl phosphate:glycerol-3-phosphate acyltransferase